MPDPTTAAVRQVAAALLPELPAIGEGCAAAVFAAVPVLREHEADDLVFDSTHANSAALLHGLLRGVPVDDLPPTREVVQSARGFVQRGVALEAVLRGYRVGGVYWCRRWAEGVQQHATDPGVAVMAVSAGTDYVLGWLEQVIDRLTDEVRDEAERLARERALARVDEVRRVLDHAGRDPAAATARLGYDVAGCHLAVVMRHEGDRADAGHALDRAIREFAAGLTAARPLIIRVEVDTAWGWIPVDGGTPVTAPGPAATVVAGHGRVGAGIEGFRSSHREAVEALRVATLARRPPGTVTSYARVAVAGVCSAAPEWTRRFVVGQLGPLAADDDESRQLRATLTAFFASESGFRATAARLGIHHNTVRYRLAKVERLLGRAPNADRLALELALHLAGRLGPAVLAEEPPAGP